MNENIMNPFSICPECGLTMDLNGDRSDPARNWWSCVCGIEIHNGPIHPDRIAAEGYRRVSNSQMEKYRIQFDLCSHLVAAAKDILDYHDENPHEFIDLDEFHDLLIILNEALEMVMLKVPKGGV